MASVYTNLYFNQPIVVLDTTSANPTSASLLLYGGFTALGATRMSGIASFVNNTQSTSTSNGAIVVSGGVAIQKNLNVGGNTIISGDLTAGSFTSDYLKATSITTTNLLSTNITSAYLSIGTGTIQNILNTNLTSVSINASNMTIGSILATTQISAGGLYAPQGTITNLVATNMTSGAFAVEQFIATNITASNVLVNTKISSA